MTPKVDTFEHDIASEIKRKEASAAQIAAASNNVGNTPEVPQKKSSRLLVIILGVLFISSVFGLIGFGYFYYTDSLLPPSQGSVAITKNDIPKNEAALTALSPTLGREIGRYVTKVEKQPAGYVLSISSYSPVFAYMVKNEDMYIEELAKIVSPAVGTSTTEIQKEAPIIKTEVATSAPKISPSTESLLTTKTSTSTLKGATSTKKIAVATSSKVVVSTTTKDTTPKVETPINVPYYKDITVSNQNMRVWTYGDRTVVYAFITTDKVAISQTTEGILSLKSAIIR